MIFRLRFLLHGCTLAPNAASWLDFDLGRQVVQCGFLREDIPLLKRAHGLFGGTNSIPPDRIPIVVFRGRMGSMQPRCMTLLQGYHQGIQVLSLNAHHLDDLHVALDAHGLRSMRRPKELLSLKQEPSSRLRWGSGQRRLNSSCKALSSVRGGLPRRPHGHNSALKPQNSALLHYAAQNDLPR